MSEAAAPPTSGAAQGDARSEYVCPPSLRKLAPEKIILTCAGACVPMDGRKVHLVAGVSYTVEVKAQGLESTVAIKAESPLFETISTTVRHGQDTTYHVEFSAGKTHLRLLPLPKSTHLHVTVSDGQNDPLHLTIPVKIWPPISAYGWSALLAFLGIAGLRIERMFAHEDSFGDIMSRIVEEIPRFGLIGAVCLFIPPVAWLVSRIIGVANLNDAE